MHKIEKPILKIEKKSGISSEIMWTGSATIFGFPVCAKILGEIQNEQGSEKMEAEWPLVPTRAKDGFATRKTAERTDNIKLLAQPPASATNSTDIRRRNVSVASTKGQIFFRRRKNESSTDIFVENCDAINRSWG